MNDHMSDVKKAYALLQLERKIVGIKFVYDKESYDAFDAIEPKKPMYYCQAVHAAGAGNKIKLTKETSGCAGSSRALGFTPAQANYYSGEASMPLGLYKKVETSKQVAMNIDIFRTQLYGVIVMPLECFETEPDTVMIFSNTRESMRVLQGYTAVYGYNNHYYMCGNQAICVEATTYPYINDRLNVSMLCAGTRFRAGWKDYEVAMGLPYSKFGGLVEGLMHTVDAIERNPRKYQIETQLKNDGLYEKEFRYGKTYFLADDNSPKEL